MATKNLLAFAVVAALLIASWLVAKNVLFDKPPVKTGDVAKNTGKDKVKDKEPPKAKDEDKLPPKAKGEVKEPIKEKEPAGEVVTPEKQPEDFLLGDPKSPEYYILAIGTTHGGAIRSLTLPKFQKADENGKPAFNADGTKMPLALIEDDPYVPSFSMYHYPNPEDTEKTGCVTTLGQKTWKLESQSIAPELCTVELSCDQIPGYPGLRIIRTFTLKPREYHVSLTIRIIDERDSKGKDLTARLFRYQLMGSHGLPIEGQ